MQNESCKANRSKRANEERESMVTYKLAVDETLPRTDANVGLCNRNHPINLDLTGCSLEKEGARLPYGL